MNAIGMPARGIGDHAERSEVYACGHGIGLGGYQSPGIHEIGELGPCNVMPTRRDDRLAHTAGQSGTGRMEKPDSSGGAGRGYIHAPQLAAWIARSAGGREVDCAPVRRKGRGGVEEPAFCDLGDVAVAPDVDVEAVGGLRPHRPVCSLGDVAVGEGERSIARPGGMGRFTGAILDPLHLAGRTLHHAKVEVVSVVPLKGDARSIGRIRAIDAGERGGGADGGGHANEHLNHHRFT